MDKKLFVDGVRPIEMTLHEIAKERRKNNIVVRRNIVKARKSTGSELRRLEDRVMIEAAKPHQKEPSLYGQAHSRKVHNRESIDQQLRGVRTDNRY